VVLLVELCPVYGVTSEEGDVSLDFYNQVMEKIFRRRTSFQVLEKDSTITLRIDPSFAAPIQVSIERFWDKVEVTAYLLADDERSLQSQIARILKNDKTLSATEVAAQLSVREAAIRPNEEIERLLKGIDSICIGTRLSPAVVLDGTKYSLWLDTKSSHLFASYSGPPKSEETEPIIVWMDDLRRAVIREIKAQA